MGSVTATVCRIAVQYHWLYDSSNICEVYVIKVSVFLLLRQILWRRTLTVEVFVAELSCPTTVLIHPRLTKLVVQPKCSTWPGSVYVNLLGTSKWRLRWRNMERVGENLILNVEVFTCWTVNLWPLPVFSPGVILKGSGKASFTNVIITVCFEDVPQAYKPGIAYEGKVRTTLLTNVFFNTAEKCLWMKLCWMLTYHLAHLNHAFHILYAMGVYI